jgi:type IV secretory pathway VirB4 component
MLSKEERKEIKKRITEINGVYNEPSTQNAIPYKEMTRDGICVIPKTFFSATEKLDFYSKSITFGDVNYQLASDEDQNNIFSAYCEIMNYFDDSVYFQLTFENRRRDLETLARKIIIPEQIDDFNDIRQELSTLLQTKMTEGDNGNELVKFMTFGMFARNLSEARTKLSTLSSEIRDKFKQAKIDTQELTGKDRLFVLYRALNPHRRNRFIFDWEYMRKSGTNTKDYIAPSSMIFKKQSFELGDCHGSVMSVKLIASELSDRILQDLLGKSELFCVNIHVKPFDIITGQNMVEKTLTDVKVMRNSIEDKLFAKGRNPDNIPRQLKETIEQIDELLTEVRSKNERIFQVSLTLRTYSKSQKAMQRQCEQIRRICQNHGNILLPCDYQQEDGLCASLPLGVTKIANKRVMHTSSLSAFMPFVTKRIFHIDSKNKIYYGLNALTRDMILADKGLLQNPNSLILGMPGSGKSFAAKFEIALAFLQTMCDIIICDPEGEYFRLVLALCGQVIKLSSASENYLNPMDIVFDDETVTKKNPIPDKVNFILSFMELVVGGDGLTAPERSYIDRAAKRIYEKFLFSEIPPTAETMPILEDLYNELEGYGDITQRLVFSLEMYVHGTQKYFNHRSNVDINNRIVCFDTNELGDSLKKLGMLIVQETVWNRVLKNRHLKKITRFYIDEFHLLLKDPQTAEYSVEFYKRFRKYYGIPCGITQNIKDFLASGQIESIFENTAFVYLLNQAPRDREIIMEKLEISEACGKYINNAAQGTGVLKFGEIIIPYENKVPDDTKFYKLISTSTKSTDSDTQQTEKELATVV